MPERLQDDADALAQRPRAVAGSWPSTDTMPLVRVR